MIVALWLKKKKIQTQGLHKRDNQQAHSAGNNLWLGVNRGQHSSKLGEEHLTGQSVSPEQFKFLFTAPLHLLISYTSEALAPCLSLALHPSHDINRHPLGLNSEVLLETA